MRKIRNFVIGGIQQKVFNLVLITILLVMAAYTVVLVYQSSQLSGLVAKAGDWQKQTITTTVRNTMDDQLTVRLGESTQLEAYIVNDMFEELASAVRMIADYAEKLFMDPEGYPEREARGPDASLEGVTSVQLLTEEGVDVNAPGVAKEISLVGNLSELLMAIYENTRVNSCYIALPSGVMLLADSDPASKLTEDGKPIPIAMRSRPWYTGAVEDGGIHFTDVISDVYTGKVGIMCGMPVYRDGEVVAVIGADLFLDGMADAVESSGEGGGFVCIVNELGHVVFSPMKEGVFKVLDGTEARDLRQLGDAPLAAFIDDAMREITEPTALQADGVSYYMCGAPVESVGWAVVNAISQEATDAVTDQVRQEFDGVVDVAQAEFYKNLSNARTTILILLLAILLLSAGAALTLSKRIVKPLGIITERIHTLGENNLQFMMEDAYRTGDEIEVLAESFANLSAKTVQYVNQVKRVTAEKERIGLELSMATAIQASQLPRLFPAFPNRSEFDVFASMTPAKEVGGDFYDFFLVDDDHIALVMADVSGKGVPAALFMMVSRVLIKTHLQSGESPAEVLENVNNMLCDGNDTGLFVTVWLSVLEISTGKGIAANAGHEHPALRRTNGEYALQIYRHSPALAVIEGIPFKQHNYQLFPGDSVFVYTDGVAEATSDAKELFGTDRMLDALNESPDAEPKEVLANVMEGINTFVAGAEQFDDITMLCLKYYGTERKQDG